MTNKTKSFSPIPRALTNRENEIMALIARGLQNAVIAKALYISPKTVNAHKEHIVEKLNLTNIGELYAKAGEYLGTFPIDPLK